MRGYTGVGVILKCLQAGCVSGTSKREQADDDDVNVENDREDT